MPRQFIRIHHHRQNCRVIIAHHFLGIGFGDFAVCRQPGGAAVVERRRLAHPAIGAHGESSCDGLRFGAAFHWFHRFGILPEHRPRRPVPSRPSPAHPFGPGDQCRHILVGPHLGVDGIGQACHALAAQACCHRAQPVAQRGNQPIEPVELEQVFHRHIGQCFLDGEHAALGVSLGHLLCSCCTHFGVGGVDGQEDRPGLGAQHGPEPVVPDLVVRHDKGHALDRRDVVRENVDLAVVESRVDVVLGAGLDDVGLELLGRLVDRLQDVDRWCRRQGLAHCSDDGLGVCHGDAKAFGPCINRPISNRRAALCSRPSSCGIDDVQRSDVDFPECRANVLGRRYPRVVRRQRLVVQFPAMHDDRRAGVGLTHGPVDRAQLPGVAQWARHVLGNWNPRTHLVLSIEQQDPGNIRAIVEGLCDQLGVGRTGDRHAWLAFAQFPLDHRNLDANHSLVDESPADGRVHGIDADIGKLVAGDGHQPLGLDPAATEHVSQRLIQVFVSARKRGRPARMVVREPDVGRARNANRFANNGRWIDGCLRKSALEATNNGQHFSGLVGDDAVEPFDGRLVEVLGCLGRLLWRRDSGRAYFAGDWRSDDRVGEVFAWGCWRVLYSGGGLYVPTYPGATGSGRRRPSGWGWYGLAKDVGFIGGVGFADSYVSSMILRCSRFFGLRGRHRPQNRRPAKCAGQLLDGLLLGQHPHAHGLGEQQ